MRDSRKLVFDILSNKIPECVPYLELLISKHVMNSLAPGMDYFEFCRAEDIDLMFVKRDFNNSWIDKEKGIYINEWDIKRKKGFEEVDDYIEGPIRSKSDLKNLKIPDPVNEKGFETLKDVVKKYKDSKAL